MLSSVILRAGVSCCRRCCVSGLLGVNVADGFQCDRGEVTAVVDKARLISDHQSSLAAAISYDDE